MSIGFACIFDPAIFDPAIFTVCGNGPAPSGGSGDTDGDDTDRMVILDRKRKQEYKAYKAKKKKESDDRLAALRLLPKPEIKPTIENPKVDALTMAPTIYRVDNEAERNKLIDNAILQRKMILELIRKEEEEAFILLMSD